jgi:hypothetical protein
VLALPIGLADMDVHHYDVACVRSARVEISSTICVSVCVLLGLRTGLGNATAMQMYNGAFLRGWGGLVPSALSALCVVVFVCMWSENAKHR